MSKRLVVCFDGTWNEPEKADTNVIRLIRMIRSEAQDGTPQIVFYDKGVGTSGPVERFLGGSFGWGLDKNVQDGYRFIGHNYHKGDELYIFGFSRGAYTARSLAGLIAHIGVLWKPQMDLLPAAWDSYRNRKVKSADVRRRLATLRDDSYDIPQIACLGVWDTVGALGVPLWTLRFLNFGRFQFHDTSPSAIVERAFHALAVDEHRGAFGPTLWTSKSAGGSSQVEQVWFPGVHADVGGGYEDDRSLGDLTLDWMVKRVAATTKLDIQVESGRIGDLGHDAIAARAAGKLHESRTKLYVFYRLVPFWRVIGGQDSKLPERKPWWRLQHPKGPVIGEAIHLSAQLRRQSDGRYRPANLLCASELPTADEQGTYSGGGETEGPPPR